MRALRSVFALSALFFAACGGELIDETGVGGGGAPGSGGGEEGGSGGGDGGGGGIEGVPQLEEGWNEFKPGGDTLCARGGEYSFWAKPGKTNKVIIDFIGGGACWNLETCRLGSGVFQEDTDSIREAISTDDPQGIYDHEDTANPFDDYFHVIVPYCTGDIHWGNNDETYGEGDSAITIHHRGAVNSRAVLDWVYENFAGPEQILVTGCSAGSYGSALWSAHVMDHYKSSKVLQFGDSGAGIVTDTFFQESFPSWKAEGAFPAFIPELDPRRVNIQEMALNDLYSYIALHFADQRMSQYNTTYDEDQVFYYKFMGGTDEFAWSAAMNASIADIEARAPNFAAFIAPGEQHCTIPYSNFYTVNANGTKLTDWLQATLDGEDVESVKCQGEECEMPTP